jgi:hypothetical protein
MPADGDKGVGACEMGACGAGALGAAAAGETGRCTETGALGVVLGGALSGGMDGALGGGMDGTTGAVGATGAATLGAACSPVGRLVMRRAPPLDRTTVELGALEATASSVSVPGPDAGDPLAARGFASGSGGETSRRNPSLSALRRARSACASSIEDE